MYRKLLLAALSAFISYEASSSNLLFNNGRTTYDIIVSENASESEKYAAKDLKNHLKLISGAEFKILGTGEGRKNHRIIIGYNSDLQALAPDLTQPDGEDQSFTYKNVGGDILIYGGSIRGTMYGVYSFLEREMGCHWFTVDYSVVPKCKSWSFNNLNHSEKPYIQDRFLFFTAGWDVIWSARNRNNYSSPPNSEGKAWMEPVIHGFSSGHSFAEYVPIKKYWNNHPEYFSEIDGKRVSTDWQLCLSNPDALRLCIEGARRKLHEGHYTIVDVSQNDSSPYCHCSRCLEMIDSLGSPTDLLLWFVNQVADAVKDEYPDKYIGTFSYEWSIPCPKTVRPRENVVIRFCTYDNCIAHPFAECELNKERLENMRQWAKIASHLYVWNYMASFRQYNVPFPFINNLAADIRLFKEMNAIGVLEEGEYQGPGGNFQELKTWLVAKLLWDPDQDIEKLLQVFFDGYYREASQPMRAYFDYTQTLADKGIHDFCYPKHYESKLFDEPFIRHALELAKEAENSCTDSLTRAHVQIGTLQAHYLHARFHPVEGLRDGTFEHICDVFNRCGLKCLSEWGDVINLNQLEYMMKYDAGIIKE